MKKKHKIHYESLNYTSSFMANYVLDEYLEGKVHSIEKHYKDIDNMNQKDFMKIMKMIHKSLDHCVVTYQGPIKVL
jgi:hypothetical protein